MNENAKIYIIRYDNYYGETFSQYYLHPENALKKWAELVEEAKQYDEFEVDGLYSFSYFNANINSDSTYIELTEDILKNIFQDS